MNSKQAKSCWWMLRLWAEIFKPCFWISNEYDYVSSIMAMNFALNSSNACTSLFAFLLKRWGWMNAVIAIAQFEWCTDFWRGFFDTRDKLPNTTIYWDVHDQSTSARECAGKPPLQPEWKPAMPAQLVIQTLERLSGSRERDSSGGILDRRRSCRTVELSENSAEAESWFESWNHVQIRQGPAIGPFMRLF